MAAISSSISKFQNLRKTDLTNICQIICRKFHQNPPIRYGRSASTQTHTHTHTHTYTHRHIHTHNLGSIATYSVKMTKYKKLELDGSIYVQTWLLLGSKWRVVTHGLALDYRVGSLLSSMILVRVKALINIFHPLSSSQTICN